MKTRTLEITKQLTDNGTLVVRLSGHLSLETVSGFLHQARPLGVEKLVLDMSDVKFLDSAGIGALVRLLVHRKDQVKSLPWPRFPSRVRQPCKSPDY